MPPLPPGSFVPVPCTLLVPPPFSVPHQSKLIAAEGVMCELDTQLSLLTGASSALQQQLGEQQDAAAAAATAARQVRGEGRVDLGEGYILE